MIGPADRPRGLVGGAFFCPLVVGPSDSVVQDVLRGDRDSADGFREMAELFVAHIEIESVVKEGDHHVRAAFFVDEAQDPKTLTFVKQVFFFSFGHSSSLPRLL